MRSIFSVVVLYNPSFDNIANLCKISELSTKLFIIDNSLTATNLESINNQTSIIYIKNDSNIGLAKALNIGINFCLDDQNCTHIALFDQDSEPDSEMFTKMINSLIYCKENIVAVCPEIVDIKNLSHTKIPSVQTVDIAITSGTLFSRNAFKVVGLMDETFFIDYIDYEWCLRAKSKNFKILKVKDAILFHNMGDKTFNFFGIAKPLHTNRTRHYYIIRNQLIFISRQYIPLNYKVIHFFKLFYRIPAYIFLSGDKVNTLKLIIKAFKDFFEKRSEYSIVKY
jgi:rhamnosyltransferase